MKNEELINLQGGGYGETWCCFCGDVYAMGASYLECEDFCQQAHDMSGIWVCERPLIG